jgi:hypothetical protein
VAKTLTLNETAAFLKTHDGYLILTHRRPDGDTVGSAAALCRALRAMGKRAWIYPNPQLTPKFAPYHAGLTGNPAEADTVISVDVAAEKLFPFGMETAKVALAIDHHGTNSGFAACTCVNEKMAACGEILVALLPLLGVEMDRQIADALYTRLGRTCTLVDGRGLISGEKVVLYCVVTRIEVSTVKQIIHSMDGTAFVTITDVSEILGQHIKQTAPKPSGEDAE